MTDETVVPCKDEVGFTEPWTWTEVSDFLELCKVCPIRARCLELVDPARNWSDGIIGGMLWLNGKPLITDYNHLHPLSKPWADFDTTKAYLKSIGKKSDY